MSTRPFAFVTGATAGIGKATAELLAESGYHLVLVGRRQERLESMARNLSEKNTGCRVIPICLDISSRQDCEEKMRTHLPVLKECTVLINNAGLARGMEPLQNGHLSDWDEMIDTNVKGLLYVTRQLLPHMVEKQRGHIVNLGSVAGRWTSPAGGVYCATKFAVRALSEGLRMDLHGLNIRVTNIEPGMVETEFSEVRLRDSERAKKVYQGMKPLSAKDVAETILWCLNRPAHVNIQEIVLFPTDQSAIQLVKRRGE